MLFEQKSWRKSDGEIEGCPCNSLTKLYFLNRFPHRFLALAIKLYDQNGQTKIFKHFAVKRFLRGLNECPERVLNSLEAASGSSLTDDVCKICSRGAIKRIHSITSIFHLIYEKSRHWGVSGFLVVMDYDYLMIILRPLWMKSPEVLGLPLRRRPSRVNQGESSELRVEG